jgi:hypothetical protein
MPEAENELQVGFDRQFIDKWLDRQRYVWAALILLLMVTFTGLLGRGPLARKTMSAGPGQLEITYERILHFKTPAMLELHLPPAAPESSHVRIRLEGAVVHDAAFQEIIPQPLSANPLAGGVVIDIPITAAANRGRILVFQQASAIGPLTSKVGLDGGPTLEFKQFVLP